ncbi:MAG: DNA helicase RecQ [Planctomycetota bacterium]|nr:DNA helicase RecQ [Planctomycetia bacterium]MDO7677208.1 DNA helicase RecQ [Pirellulales bacterium]
MLGQVHSTSQSSSDIVSRTSNAACEPRSAEIEKILSRWWGFDRLRPLQSEAISAALDGRDSLVVMPTGGGKSLCYQIPPLLSESTDVVISPLVALMKDQVDSLDSIGYPAAALYSGIDDAERSRIREKLLAGHLRLLFVAPERLLNSGLLDLLSRVDVRRFAIDEAHCISHWGHDFRPEYRQLSMLRERFPSASFHAFTATATPRVREDIASQLSLHNPEIVVGCFDRPNLVYRVIQRTDRIKQTLQILGRHPKEAAIVYCISRKETERLATHLAAEGILARPYHAGLEAQERHRTQEAFAQDRVDVVVATVAFGMGIDRSNVRLVLHTALPKSLEAYQQETGRAGRDGLAAECVLLYSSADVFSWESLVRKSAEESDLNVDEAEALIKSQLEHLHTMRRYAQTARCRHATLSEYFGQTYPNDSCGACDVCLGETENMADSTIVAQKILSCVARVEERFGVRHVAEVLRGAKTEGVSRHGHDQLSTFGLLDSLDQRTCENLVHQLLDQGFLSRSPGDRPVVMLNGASWTVLRGDRSVVLLEPKVRSTKKSTIDNDDWQGVDRDLFEKLRQWRRNIAEIRGKPAWTILDDRALRLIAKDMPTSPAALLRIKGIGEKRLAEFGESLLDLVDCSLRMRNG